MSIFSVLLCCSWEKKVTFFNMMIFKVLKVLERLTLIRLKIQNDKVKTHHFVYALGNT